MRTSNNEIKKCELRVGRSRPRTKCEKRKSARRGISESLLATLGAAFIAVYFAGLLLTAPGGDAADSTDEFGATPVFAEIKDDHAEENEEKAVEVSLGEALRECVRYAFGEDVEG